MGDNYFVPTKQRWHYFPLQSPFQPSAWPRLTALPSVHTEAEAAAIASVCAVHEFSMQCC